MAGAFEPIGTPNSMTEEAIIEETLKGNSQAFGELILKYEAGVYRLILLRVRNAADAEEIAQEVFLTAFRKLGQLSDRSRFGAWLRAIAVRQCAMWFRSAKKDGKTCSYEEEHCSDLEQAAPELPPEGRDPFDISGLIRELPAGMQSAARLCLEEELDPAAAAGRLGLKPGTVRKRFYDARARLQRSIVQKAEEIKQMDLLPRDFARLCICRCEKAQVAQKGGDPQMKELKNCGCGCMDKARQEGKEKQAPATSPASESPRPEKK